MEGKKSTRGSTHKSVRGSTFFPFTMSGSIRRVMSHQTTVYWFLTAPLTAANRGPSVRGTSLFSCISPIYTNLQTLKQSRITCWRGHREGADWASVTPTRFNNIKKETFIMQTHICSHVWGKLQGLKEEVNQHKHSSPYLLSFLCLLYSRVFLLLDVFSSCWHSCESVRLDSHSDDPHLYVGVCSARLIQAKTQCFPQMKPKFLLITKWVWCDVFYLLLLDE